MCAGCLKALRGQLFSAAAWSCRARQRREARAAPMGLCRAGQTLSITCRNALEMELYEPPYEIDFSQRDPADGVDDLFYQRWSPRAFKKTTLPERALRAIFDAARWAPSSRNAQPWQFVTNTDETDFDLFCGLLVEENQKWAKNASLIGFIVARRHLENSGKPNNSAMFDCGAAWLCMTLQARRLGLYTHGMGGIKRAEVYRALNIDEEKYHVICGFAIGVLDAQKTHGGNEVIDRKPSARRPLDEVWRRGKL